MSLSRDRERLEQVQLLLTFEAVLETAATRRLMRDMRGAARVLEEHPDAPTMVWLQRVDEFIEDDSRWEWVELLGSHYNRTGNAFARRFIEQLQPPETKAAFDTFRLAMERFILRWGLDRARKITETTRLLLCEKIVQGVQDGLGAREIARKIRGDITGIGAMNVKQRAETIAITETHTAATYAGDESVRALALPKVLREWLAVEDGRTRPTHRAADGQKVEMDEPFTVGGYKMMRPGDPMAPASQTIRCRCVVGYAVPE